MKRATTRHPVGRRGPGTIRIIGGEWKRQTLDVPDVAGLRPTPDRVRETLFNWLTHAFGDFQGRSVLDLFAGTGALGFEAASRGAASVTLVENNGVAAKGLQAARTRLKAPEIEIREGDAVAVGRQFRDAGRHFDLVLLDPPFGQRWVDTALPLASELCLPDGMIYIEAEVPVELASATALGLEIYRADKAGEVFYHLLRRNIKER